MDKKTIRDVELTGKRVLMRVDFNVPLDGETITDDTRVQAALPTVRAVLEQGACLVLMSHLGRPKDEVKPEFSLAPVAKHLGSLLGKDIKMAPDTTGPDVKAMVDSMRAGDVVLLENTRFHAEEEGKKCSEDEQKSFAQALSELGDVYVNDAFGTAHRSHASTAVVCDYMDTCVAGLLMEKELVYLGGAIANPERPFVAIIGGAKISGKLEVMHSLIEKVNTLLIGGGMAYTFLKAQGHDVGNSLVEEDLLDTATKTLAYAESKGVRMLLPIDNVAADKFDVDASTQVVGQDIPEGWMALDIGPEAATKYADVIKDAKTVVWNGPMGCFEMAPFASGTLQVAKAVADSDATSIIGGGDSVSAVNKSGLADKMSHISTGGGASLEFLEGKTLPGVAALDDK